MLKYDPTWLKKHVREAFLTVSGLKYAKAAWIAESSVEPAAYENICKHINLIIFEFQLCFFLLGLACVIFWLHDHNTHHCSYSIWHLICADNQTFEYAMDTLDALISQIFVFVFGWDGWRCLIWALTHVTNSSLDILIKKGLRVDSDLKVWWFVVSLEVLGASFDNFILQHYVSIFDFFINFFF